MNHYYLKCKLNIQLLKHEIKYRIRVFDFNVDVLSEK